MTHAGLSSTMLWLMLLLGAYHGLNPGMGWLFAVALGMQEQKGSAVARSLIPIALGHAVAIGSVVLTSVFLGMTLPLMVIRYLVAALLVGMGIYCLVRHRHPRWVRMQVGFRDLTVWSFLMASAHGAGLMVVPVLLRSDTVEAQSRIGRHNHISHIVTPLAGMLATGVHTVAYLAVTGLLAWVVYRKLGLAVLRKAWLNFDLIWAAALVATGLATLLI
jgi:multisubunit Na+/H+ antiporter MnhC subunit